MKTISWMQNKKISLIFGGNWIIKIKSANWNEQTNKLGCLISISNNLLFLVTKIYFNCKMRIFVLKKK
jgi:hypothetical protein